MLPLCFRSRSFEDVTSFKPFNSTGATSLLNHFNGVSFEWALTHRSFPRILPDSSYFPGGIRKFFSKFDVRMIYHQSNVFSKIFQILFIVGSTFHFSSRSASTILGGVSRYLSLHLKTEEEFSSISCSILFKIRGSSSRPSSHNFFECEISFHLSGAIQESFQFDSLEAIISELFIPAFSSHTPNFTGASFK